MKLQSNKTVFSEDDLKALLTEIKSGQKTWKDVDLNLTVRSMCTHIGSTDPVLRDKLIYTLFFRLIIEDNLIEPDLMKELLQICQKDLLFYGIGDKETDTVFTRAFTTLLIALIIYRDIEDDFLSKAKVDQVGEHLIRYINEEKDVRGYIAGKGWAHSIAHVADAFDELIKNPKISRDLYPEIFHSLWNKMFISDSVYLHDEGERVVTPIIEMLNRGLDSSKIESLIDSIKLKLERKKIELDEENYWLLFSNVKTFLKSFYIKLNHTSKYDSIRVSIEKCLDAI
ncbi:DUF2785 domain-containing protein [Rossellomorea aquimaris]|uniref:DUF2785 domain-containing protein n=1 Tax=Rossellomorea aquimaris TaxID=189382 RepID=A0A1J6W2I8_9BACI|nr:DUF2785 domain-containing protein [Rossellomorea aquimaris]OIU71810.1 hypothetical protein BHE18_03905 [Rossellomorea aquimaris]